MFLRNFVKRGLLDAVGRQPDFWVILNAASWMEKGVLLEKDLEEIQAAIDAKNTPTDTSQEDGGEINGDGEDNP